ncbi:hypothetical protein GW17_00043655, partial [Ensete ventricosum]
WRRGGTCHSSLNGSQRNLRYRGSQVIALAPRPGPTPVGSTLDLGAVVDY